jgi:hypothetical protein
MNGAEDQSFSVLPNVLRLRSSVAQFQEKQTTENKCTGDPPENIISTLTCLSFAVLSKSSFTAIVYSFKETPHAVSRLASMQPLAGSDR